MEAVKPLGPAQACSSDTAALVDGRGLEQSELLVVAPALDVSLESRAKAPMETSCSLIRTMIAVPSMGELRAVVPESGGYRRLVTVDEVLTELRRSGEPQRVAALKRSGVLTPAFGVGLPALRSLAKRIGRDHELALALWDTGVREARILASLIDERERVTKKQMNRWAESFDSWEICDQCCQNLFAQTAFALDKAVEWMQRPEELVKRAGFVLVAVRAVHDKRSDDQTFDDLLSPLVAAADDERLYVRKGASWAFRQIGKRSERLRTRVLATMSPRLDRGGRGIRWVARDVSRELRSRPPGRRRGR
jgi:3-methyladenine DNA glycosylase AlkD